jgi:hypothetical protein
MPTHRTTAVPPPGECVNNCGGLWKERSCKASNFSYFIRSLTLPAWSWYVGHIIWFRVDCLWVEYVWITNLVTLCHIEHKRKFYKSSTTKVGYARNIWPLASNETRYKGLDLENGYSRYFMLSHYTVLFKMAYRQKVGELQFPSRMKNANVIRPAPQSYFLYEERKGE